MTTHYLAIVVTQKSNGEMDVKPLVSSADKDKVEKRIKEFSAFASDNQTCDLFEVEEI